jgi:DnaJ-class molecular chaperone
MSRYNAARANRTCQNCGGFGGHGEYERHRAGEKGALWVECDHCGGTGQKKPEPKKA